MYYIFSKNGEFLANSDLEPNAEDLATRGEIAFESEKVFDEPFFNGEEIIEKGLPPSQYHEWDGSEWVITPEQQQAVISAEKSAKLAEINQKAQAFINKLAEYDKTPAFERDTWPIQRDEAFAWFADNNAPTPTLDLISLARGVPVEVLRQKAYEKAIAYQQVAAIVSGQRQAYEDKLNAAETLEQVQAIEPIYQLPQGA